MLEGNAPSRHSPQRSGLPLTSNPSPSGPEISSEVAEWSPVCISPAPRSPCTVSGPGGRRQTAVGGGPQLARGGGGSIAPPSSKRESTAPVRDTIVTLSLHPHPPPPHILDNVPITALVKSWSATLCGRELVPPSWSQDREEL